MPAAGVPGLSENIRVISVIGQFLEHSRVFYFRSGGQNELEGKFFIGSADWMTRNLHGRVEVAVPIDDKLGKEKIWEMLQLLLKDRRQTWDMESDGTYVLRQPTHPGEEIPAQELLAEKTRLKAISFKMEELKN